MTNIANTLTLVRVFATPVIIYFIIKGHYEITFYIFLFASLTDAIDGIIARKFNQITPFGTYLDPLADKFMLLSLLIVLAYYKDLPVWFTVLISTRECFTILAVIHTFIFKYTIQIKIIITSKISTALQMLLIGFIIYNKINNNKIEHYELLLNALLYTITFMTILSAIIYFWHFSKNLFYHGQ